MTASKEQLLKRLRSVWNGILQEQGELDIDITLLTADGAPGQPLLYDIVQHIGAETYTYTLIEMAEQAETVLDLAAASYYQTVDVLQNLLLEAQYFTDFPATDVKLVSIFNTDTLGLTYMRARSADQQKIVSFPTNYQTFFTARLLRAFQYEQSGVLFNQITASMNSFQEFDLRFGAL